MMNKRKAELLAPAGSFDSLKAAVAAGADAIYMGGSRFGARAYAQNAAGQEMVGSNPVCPSSWLSFVYDGQYTI